MSEYIEVGQPLQFTDPNTPTRVGEIVENVSDIYNISSPRLGMQVFVKNEKKSFVITSLKSKVINGVDVPEAAVEAFEPVGAKTITWNDQSNMNDFVVAGVYDIKGERKMSSKYDNLPIMNSGDGHSFNARLTVLDSSIPGTGKNDDKCVTQLLTLSNRLGQGEAYIRTGKGSSLSNIVWENWGTLQRNVNVGQVYTLDNLIDNGIYSGVYVKNVAEIETFVMVVINNYAAASQPDMPKSISQFKYSVSLGGSFAKYETRVGTGVNDWSYWEILNNNEINAIKTGLTEQINGEKTRAELAEATLRKLISDLVGESPATLDTIHEISAWILNDKTGAAAMATKINANTKAINEEKERAEEMEQQLQEGMDADKQESQAADAEIRANAMQYNTLGVNVYANKAEIYGRSIDTTPRVVEFPAATTEKAGVMSAEDKRNLFSVIGESLAEFDFTTGSINNYANRSFNYNFVKGQRYRLEVLTEDSIATTYFSIRSSNNTEIALQNHIMEGSGRRSVEFTSEADADLLYMSIQSNGVAVVYDVKITNLSTASVASLAHTQTAQGQLIDDLTRTLLQLPTTDDFVEGKRLDASGNILSFSDCSATEKYFYIPAKTKISVKGRIFAGYTFVCVYDANYKAIHILQGQGSNTDVEYTLEYDYPIYIRIATTTSKISDFSISYDGDTVWQDVSNVNNRVTSIENATESLGKPNTLNYEDFEIGYIGIDRTGWSYRDDTDSRVRMKAGITYHLFVGDVVKLPDGVRAYLGYRVGNTYDFKSWVTNEFTIVTEGDYKILLSGVSESTLSSKFDLLSGVSIVGGERRYENTLPIDADALATMRVINHRGFNVEAPENTLPAFELSKLKGFRYVEADIRFTADGVAVCLHDDTVDRTSNGSGSVDTMTLEELRALDFGSWFSADYAGVQIPTFEEFIVLCKQLGLKPYIELKNGTAEQIKQLFDLVRLYGMEKHSTFISFNLSFLQRVIDNSDKVRIGLLADTYSEEYLNKLISLKGDKRDVFAALDGNAINDEVIMTIRQNGCDVETYTAPWSGFILKVDGVTTDSKLYWDYSGSSSVWRSKTNGWKE